MGNSLGSKKAAKIMKINGESFKLKTPVKAGAVVNDFPGHVLLDSEAVKHFGVRAKPLEPDHHLDCKRLYFLVEPPRRWKQGEARRVRSGIKMSAKERLESLMLSRRSASDLSITNNGGKEKVRMKMKLPKAQVEKLKQESESSSDFAHKILDLCLLNSPNAHADKVGVLRANVRETPHKVLSI